MAFDANSDGVMDVADGAWHLARNLRGGAELPCPAAVEGYDSVGDAATGLSIWYALVAGSAVPELAADACAAPTPSEGACGDGLALSIDAPVEATGSFVARVQLVSPDLPVEAWSVSVLASGCTIARTSLYDTLGADRRDGVSGVRNGGFAAADLSGSGAVSLVVLDLVEGSTVSPTEPTPILELNVSASASDCGTCTLSLEDGQVGRGLPLDNAVSSAGRSYSPPKTGATVNLCP